MVASLFAIGFVAFVLVAIRWRRRSRKLAVLTGLWAVVAYAVPGLLALLSPSSLRTSDGEAEPYLLLGFLWIFLLIPSLTGFALAQAHIRSGPRGGG